MLNNEQELSEINSKVSSQYRNCEDIFNII